MSGGPLATRRLHFVGIGGAGMSGLAIVARALGAEVTGSDRAESSYTARLRASGIQPAARHDAANLPEDAEVVVSTAIPEDNPELAAARQAGARVLHRGELLGEVSRLKRSIAIAGTHGKTTTCGMAVHALAATGRDPAFLVGGELRSAGHERGLGGGRLDRRGGRRVGSVVPGAQPRRCRGHQRGARPSPHLPLAVRAPGGVRGLRRPGGCADRRAGRGPGGRALLRDRVGASCGPSTWSWAP